MITHFPIKEFITSDFEECFTDTFFDIINSQNNLIDNVYKISDIVIYILKNSPSTTVSRFKGTLFSKIIKEFSSLKKTKKLPNKYVNLRYINYLFNISISLIEKKVNITELQQQAYYSIFKELLILIMKNNLDSFLLKNCNN